MRSPLSNPSPSRHRTIGDFSGSRDNNFNLLRFAAACGVILSHSILLSGNLDNGLAWALGYMSVNCFFVISGFLVTRSLTQRKKLPHFLVARCLRIYPALFVCVTLCVLALGVLNQNHQLGQFLSNPLTLEFWLKNSFLVFGEVTTYLPTEIFSSNPVKNQINAPLWTLQYEILVYGLLGFIYYIARLLKSDRPEAVFLFMIVVFTFVTMLMFLFNVSDSRPETGLGANIARFSAMFFYGSLLYLSRNKVPLKTSILLGICLLILIGFSKRELFVWATYLSLGYLLIYLAYVPGGWIRRFNAFGDYSYGLYIYAFPIQQLYVSFFPGIEAVILFALAIATTLPVAMLSWHLIERPALSKKPAI